VVVIEPSAKPAIAVLRWPSELAHRDTLTAAGQPRLLLVAPESDPPDGHDCLEDWVRLPADDRDVAARLRGLEVRAARHQVSPATDERGRLTFNGDWVALSPIGERIVSVLTGRFGEVVSRDELLAAGWPDEHPSDAALRVHLTRLRRDIAPLGLEIATVRGFGHVLQLASA
jgi:DNA-binding response OmpR family regulator